VSDAHRLTDTSVVLWGYGGAGVQSPGYEHEQLPSGMSTPTGYSRSMNARMSVQQTVEGWDQPSEHRAMASLFLCLAILSLLVVAAWVGDAAGVFSLQCVVTPSSAECVEWHRGWVYDELGGDAGELMQLREEVRAGSSTSTCSADMFRVWALPYMCRSRATASLTGIHTPIRAGGSPAFQIISEGSSKFGIS
jgi:hypothetical protein